VTWVTAWTNPREDTLSFLTKQERDMSNELHELSIGDLDEISGGDLRYFPPGLSITPSIPIPPPVVGPLGPGAFYPGGHGSFDPALLQ
jgi:hypothetical protein